MVPAQRSVFPFLTKLSKIIGELPSGLALSVGVSSLTDPSPAVGLQVSIRHPDHALLVYHR